MAEGTITIGSTTLDTPRGYTHEPDKLETYRRSLDGTLHITRAVTDEDQPVSKFVFEVKDVVNSKMLELKEEAAHIGNLYYIDYLKIMEVLSGDGSTKTFYLQRIINTATGMTVEVNGVSQEIGVDVTVTLDDSGRGKLVFDSAPTDVDDNIVVKYEPKFNIHITSFVPTHEIKDITFYTLICEEV